MATQQNQISLRKENCTLLKGIVAAFLFRVFHGLFEVIAQSARGTATLFLNVCGGF